MVHFEESTRELCQNAESLGFSLEDIAFLDLSPSSEALVDGAGYDVFGPSEVEGVYDQGTSLTSRCTFSSVINPARNASAGVL